jgi:Ca2+-transporting ATPase
MGTLVVTGTGKALVVTTGRHTRLGTIAESLNEHIDESTPLQKNIHHLAKFLMYAIFAILAAILVLGLLRGYELFDLVLIAIAIAVAAMPEGLPAAVTVILAIGMESILKKGGLVRNLLAAETLGETTVILTDKTGTLTKAQMQVGEIITLSSLLGTHMEVNLEHASQHKTRFSTHTDGIDVLKMSILASDAFIENEGEALSDWVVRGRPVEKAIITAGLEIGASQKELLEEFPRVDYLPFDASRRFAGSLHAFARKKSKRLYITGAPEYLLEHVASVYVNGKVERLTKEKLSRLVQAHHDLSAKGMRLIGVGYKDITAIKLVESEVQTMGDFVFGGFIALHDPLRADVPGAIAEVQHAGVHVIMATGDNAETALAIAREAGIIQGDEKAILGHDTERMSDEELSAALKEYRVFARVLPEHKLRIARLLRVQGEVVAMTGDGVNDAPALRNADIGLALGSGTEVAKDASDIILLQDSFSVITAAIEEGRRIRDNLKKIIAYLLSTSFSEIIVVSIALILGKPLPLLPSQILWTKIVEEGFMNFSFAFEPLEEGATKRDPRNNAAKEIVSKHLKRLVACIAISTGVFLTCLYLLLLHLDVPTDTLRTLMFIAVSIDSISFAFSMKNLHRPLWRISLFSNKYLLGALTLSISALLLALTLPVLQNLLALTPPTYITLCAVIIFALFNMSAVEVSKYIVFGRHEHRVRATV